MNESQEIKIGTLYVVATPIGNLEDISLRAIRILSEVDLIAAEDTRQARKLLSHLNLSKRCLSYHEHNRHLQDGRIIAELLRGMNIALISDAGIPGISDPGQELVAELHQRRMPVTVIPGATAGVAALVLSGLKASRHTFEGFLPHRGSKRQQHLEQLRSEERTMILYEAPHRLQRTLEDLIATLGSVREAALVRELTKIHEEMRRGTLTDLLSYAQSTKVRGECVLIITGAAAEIEGVGDPQEGVSYYWELVERGETRQAALKDAAKRSGLSRDDLYRLLHEQKEEEECSLN